MSGAGRSWGRAAAFAAGIPLVAGAAAAALARLPLAPADALAVESLDAASRLALLAAAGASLSRDGAARRLGLGRGRLRFGAAALGVLGLLGASHALDAALVLAGVDRGAGLARFDAALRGVAPAALVFPLAALALGAALGEELFFRGLLQRGLEGRLGATGAIAVAALAFGAAHGDWVHGAAASVLGLYLGALAWSAGSIRVAIAAHAVNNGIAVLETAAGLRAWADAPLALLGGLAVAALGLAAVARAQGDERGRGAASRDPR
jgi:hypothetical protein